MEYKEIVKYHARLKPKETVDFNIRWAWHQISKMYNVEAAKHDQTMSTGFVLLNIDMDKGTPSTKLGPSMGMEPRSLTRILKSMEEKGMIERKPDKDDKRMVRICLTPKGIKNREVARNSVLTFNYAVYDRVPKEKMEVFIDVIQSINNIIETEGIFKQSLSEEINN